MKANNYADFFWQIPSFCVFTKAYKYYICNYKSTELHGHSDPKNNPRPHELDVYGGIYFIWGREGRLNCRFADVSRAAVKLLRFQTKPFLLGILATSLCSGVFHTHCTVRTFVYRRSAPCQRNVLTWLWRSWRTSRRPAHRDSFTAAASCWSLFRKQGSAADYHYKAGGCSWRSLKCKGLKLMIIIKQGAADDDHYEARGWM